MAENTTVVFEVNDDDGHQYVIGAVQVENPKRWDFPSLWDQWREEHPDSDSGSGFVAWVVKNSDGGVTEGRADIVSLQG